MKCAYCEQEKPTIEITCPECGGAGGREFAMEYVSHDMALDAGDPELEGQEWGRPDPEPCQRCETTGKIFVCAECGFAALGLGIHAEC